MNKFSIFTLKALRRIYLLLFPADNSLLECDTDPDSVSEILYKTLMDDKPCMIARFGGFELSSTITYLGIKQGSHSWWKYIQGNSPAWWWGTSILGYMKINAGFFPPTIKNMERFGRLMLEYTKEVDILGSWLVGESYLQEQLHNARLVHLRLLEPFWSARPWTKALTGKKVLVVHPFVELIEKQYAQHRTKLFNNQDILPEFELQTIAAVQSIGGADNGFTDWFEALEWMEKEIDKRDYDICLICCGAYGFPLAAHVKRQGKKAIHLGGSLQLLFGIIGSRWEDPNYGVKEWQIPAGSYSKLINDSWCRPGRILKPHAAEKVEGGCYW